LRALREAFDLLAASPRIGTPYPSATVPHARRLALRRTRFHVYYEIGDDQDVIVLAVWSALRGHGPPSMGPTVA